jgi:hypothetical protein
VKAAHRHVTTTAGAWRNGVGQADPAGVAAYIMAKASDQHIVFGPLAFRPCDPPGSTFSVLAIGTGDVDGKYHCDLLFLLDDAGRAAIIEALKKPGFTLHVLNDELAAARRCEALWPCEKSRDAVRRVEEERRSCP